MNDRDLAIEYLREGHTLLKAYGMYVNKNDLHTFAIDRTLSNLEQQGGVAGAAKAAAALQALYEAKQLVTLRASIEGRRIILGDWFISLAVNLALPIKNESLTSLMLEELCMIGTDLEHTVFRTSKKAFCKTIDRFTDALTSEKDALSSQRAPRSNSNAIAFHKRDHATFSFSENKLLTTLDSGYYKSAVAETRLTLTRMEECLSSLYDCKDANERDGWIYNALMSGGKRLRPMLVSLCAGFGQEDQAAHGDAKVKIMAAIELIHSASLVHDDIVDRSPIRRSRATINAEKGDGYAAMCGFTMISDALRLVSESDQPGIPELIANIPMRMCSGELNQLDIENKPELQSIDEYYERISRKTASLIEGSCLCGATISKTDQRTMDALSSYGQALGLLFQLRDDLLDYEYNPSDGKPVSQDMERGIYSLPLLYARDILSKENAPEAKILDTALRKHIKTQADFHYMIDLAQKTGGIAYTKDAIMREADKAYDALSQLPGNAYTEALSLLVSALTKGFEQPKKQEHTKIVRMSHDKS